LNRAASSISQKFKIKLVLKLTIMIKIINVNLEYLIIDEDYNLPCNNMDIQHSEHKWNHWLWTADHQISTQPQYRYWM